MSESTAGAWVLDPAGSSVEFVGKAFWGMVPVRGTFKTVSGQGAVGADGSVSGQVVIDAASLDTKNKKQDTHLRSADFFNIEKYPTVTVTVTSAVLDGSSLKCTGTMEAAGKSAPVSFSATVESADAEAVMLKAVLPMARSTFGMTWQQPGMPGSVKDIAEGTVTTRFVRP